MKLTLIMSLFALSFSALAQKVEINSTDAASINIAQIERAITVNSANGRISVVEVDNGGSTDIGSAVYPSELLVTYFQDGEMNNVQATFDLGPIYSLKAATMKDKKTVVVDVEVKDMQLKTIAKKITVDLTDLVKKAAAPEITVGEFETQTLKAKVILSEKLGDL